MISFLTSLITGPFVKLAEKYMDISVDKEKLEAGLKSDALKADAQLRATSMSFIEFRFPLMVVLLSHAFYMSSIAIDSTFPSELLNPLELPGWYKPYFAQVTVALLGLATVAGMFSRKK